MLRARGRRLSSVLWCCWRWWLRGVVWFCPLVVNAFGLCGPESPAVEEEAEAEDGGGDDELPKRRWVHGPKVGGEVV